MIPAKSVRVMLPSRRRLGSITRTDWDAAETSNHTRAAQGG
jgi:hypothetical protein